MVGTKSFDRSGEGPLASIPLVFVSDLSDPVIDDEDRHHLTRVLRLRDGDPITIGDGFGSWRTGLMGSEVGSLGPILHVEKREPQITIAFSLIKGERPELVIQKLTELGVDVILPFTSERSVARWTTQREAKQLVRMRKIARSASMQSKRAWLPEVLEPADFAAVIQLPNVVAADRGGDYPSLAYPTVMVGPEGGWSDAELERLPRRIALGDHVLRAETASIVAGGVLTAMRAGLIASPQ